MNQLVWWMFGLALILSVADLFLYCIMLALLRIETLLRRDADLVAEVA